MIEKLVLERKNSQRNIVKDIIHDTIQLTKEKITDYYLEKLNKNKIPILHFLNDKNELISAET